MFQKSVEKIQVLVKSDKNSGYFMWSDFMWSPKHILCEVQYTFYVKSITHFMWSPLHILCEV
jgi:hypothetical protein